MRNSIILLLFIFIPVVIALLVFFNYKDQKIEIIYFTNEKCIVNYLTDKFVEDAKNDFGDRVEIKKFCVNLYENDPPDSKEVKELREKYQVFGAPVIIINEKEYKKEYKYETFKDEICNSFVVKPLVCL